MRVNTEIIDGKKIVETKALIDSGAQGIFMNERFAKKHQLPLLRCVFNAKEVEYLGFIVKPNEISMDPTKLAGIRDWIPPTNVKGARSFLGFGNFY